MRRELDRLSQEISKCGACPRLASYRESVTGKHPYYWNKPVPGFGDPNAKLLVVGLAPGAQGANRTGRPFTGDFAGEWLYRILHQFGFSSHEQSVAADDSLRLSGAWITNALRCVPPENKPTGAEVRQCADFLAREIALLEKLEVVFCLGKVAHDAFLAYVKNHVDATIKKKDYPFGHGARHDLPGRPGVLFDTYHSSRYNVSTRVLRWEMFEEVFARVAREAR